MVFHLFEVNEKALSYDANKRKNMYSL